MADRSGESAEPLPLFSDEPPWRAELATDFARCRASTLALFARIDPALLRVQLHPGFSPLGWHLGHIAFTEALWLLGPNNAVTTPALSRAFAVDGLAKAERVRIPEPAAIHAYVGAVRKAVLQRLCDPDAALEARLWRFVLQHEAQHAETVSFLHALSGDRAGTDGIAPDARPLAFVRVPGGTAAIGYAGPEALDNEQPAHSVTLAPFLLARHPTTQAQFAAFIADGGYRRRDLWSEDGWAWRTRDTLERPCHWRAGAPDHPVCGVSAHEADAYCRWAGLRLPSEFEWEHAARGVVVDENAGNLGGIAAGTTAVGQFPRARSADGALDLIGNVWEWTASVFAPYPGFCAWPYEGYSQSWFDGRHRVLRGGSWATRSFALRPSFRNWYGPETRQILAGFRCARDSAA